MIMAAATTQTPENSPPPSAPDIAPPNGERPVMPALIVSPDPSVRADVASCFETAAGPRWAWLQAETPARGMDLALARNPKFIVLDLRGQSDEALRVAEKISETEHTVPILGLFSPQHLGPDMDLPTFLLDGMRRGLFDFLRLPLAPEEVKRVLGRLASSVLLSPSPVIVRSGKRVISFISGKGGVGKTTLTANVACVLAAQHPGQVAIVDASMDLGNVSDYLNIKPNVSLYDAIKARGRLDRDLLTSLMTRREPNGVMVLGGPKKLEQMLAVTAEDLTQVLLAVRSAFRYVIVDTLPMFNAISIAVGDLSDSIVVVTEALVPAVTGTRDLLERLQEAGYPPNRVRVLLNKYNGRAGENIEAEMVAQTLQRSLDWVLPEDKRMAICANEGRPFFEAHPSTATARKIQEITAELTGTAAAPAPSGWNRLVSFIR